MRRADGQQVELNPSSLKRMLAEATAVRLEEIVLEVPDGRKLTTLVNATPILSAQGRVGGRRCRI